MKRIVSLLLVAVIMLSSVPNQAMAEINMGTETFSVAEELMNASAGRNADGFLAVIDDSDAGAIKIETADDLNNIRNDMYGTYVLANDIDMTNYGTWTPIGTTAATAFHGKIDGQGHKIQGLKVSQNITSGTLAASVSYTAGFLGVCDGAQIKNIDFESAAVTIETSSGYRYPGNIDSDYSVYAGIIAGVAKNETIIYNCHTSGSVLAKTSGEGYSAPIAGGLLGHAEQTIISYCYNTGSVQAYKGNQTHTYNAYAGGIVGHIASEGVIDCSYNTGGVSAQLSSYGEAFSG